MSLMRNDQYDIDCIELEGLWYYTIYNNAFLQLPLKRTFSGAQVLACARIINTIDEISPLICNMFSSLA